MFSQVCGSMRYAAASPRQARHVDQAVCWRASSRKRPDQSKAFQKSRVGKPGNEKPARPNLQSNPISLAVHKSLAGFPFRKIRNVLVVTEIMVYPASAQPGKDPHWNVSLHVHDSNDLLHAGIKLDILLEVSPEFRHSPEAHWRDQHAKQEATRRIREELVTTLASWSPWKECLSALMREQPLPRERKYFVLTRVTSGTLS